MTRSLARQVNAQAVLELYDASDRLRIVEALNEDRRRHRAAREAARWLRSRLHR
jgi:hypothetical protein